jgi:outer membrane protein
MAHKFLLRPASWFLSFSLCFLSGPTARGEDAATRSAPKDPIASYSQPESIPLTLEDCFKLALDVSDTVAIQREAIARANAQMFIAASEALPEINFVATRETQNNPGIVATSGSVIDSNIKQRQFTIQQPIFQGFKAVGAISGAGSYKQQQKDTWIRTKELLYQDVAAAFYGVLRYQKEIAITREIHELLEQRIKELEEREKIGRSRTSEVATARTSLDSLEADLAGMKGSLATFQFLLEYLIGMEIENRKLEDKDDQNPSTLSLANYLGMASSRSDVRAAEQAVKTAWRGILVAQSGFWPTANLGYTKFTHREGPFADSNWDLLLTMTVPLFSGTQTIGQVKDAVGILKQQKSYFSLAKRQAMLEIKQSYDGWRFSREEYLAFRKAVEAATESYKLQTEEYRRSLVSNLDVLAALQSLNNARTSANQSFYQMKLNEGRLKVAIGEVL